MKTYCGSNTGSQIEPALWNAKESVWVISPWLGKDYTKQLGELSQKGIEVRIVTSNVDYNRESLEILKAYDNPNLILLVLDKEKVGFIHSKLYLIDKLKAFSGSANLTYSGLNSNVESLSIAETRQEVQQIEMDFMRIWMDFERKGMTQEELSQGTSYSLRNAFPLVINFGDNVRPNIKSKKLVYRPYYFFEFIFRGSVRAPPLLFEDSGFLVLDGVNRQVFNDDLLTKEIATHQKTDYVIKTENKYTLKIDKPTVNLREARELVINYIRKKNTHHYLQHYGSRSYDRLFVPKRYDISFIRSGFVQVPLWYIEVHEGERRKREDVIFGTSGGKWTEFVFCSECNSKVGIEKTVVCQNCGDMICQDCIHEVGIIFKKKLCTSCL